MERLGALGCTVDIAPHADVLALIGAARSRRQPPPVQVVLDFGGTAVKRAVALSQGGVLERVEVLSSRPAPPPDPVLEAAGVASFVVEAIAETLVEAGRYSSNVDPHVTVSLASYVVEGRPVSSHGTYGSLGQLDRRQLDADLQLRTGAPIHLELVHDGTAAARGIAEPGRAGVIVVGTYLAAGFPPPIGHLAPMAEDLRIARTSAR